MERENSRNWKIAPKRNEGDWVTRLASEGEPYTDKIEATPSRRESVAVEVKRQVGGVKLPLHK
jgi:hypothetical protein